MNILVYAGLAIMAIGVVVFLWPPRKEPVAQGVIGDIGEVIGKINDMLDRLDKRYRPGLVLMFFGLALVGLGVFLQTKDATKAAEAAKAGAAVLMR